MGERAVSSPMALPRPVYPTYASSTQVMHIDEIRALLAEHGDELDVDSHDRETLPAPDSDAER